MKKGKRSLALLLAALLCASLLPGQAMAAEEEVIVVEEPAVEIEIDGEAAAAEQNGAADAEDATTTEAETPDGGAATEAGLDNVSIKLPVESIIRNVDDTVFREDGTDELLGYLYHANGDTAGLTEEITSGSYLSGTTAGKNLSGFDYKRYEATKAMAAKVAAGKTASTVVTLTATDAGLDGRYFSAAELGVSAIVVDGAVNDAAVEALINRLYGDDFLIAIIAAIYDCPYEMYWRGLGQPELMETYGLKIDYIDGEYQFYVVGTEQFALPVYETYSAGTDYTVNSSKIAAVNSAINNAKSIVNKYAGSSDYGKLEGYMRELCALNTYNTAAANGQAGTYGDPWQIVYMFDGNENTNVVCEGYSKAFQYLCEKSVFNSSRINTYSVSGTCGGPHMWNVVHMDDNRNYLVDVTNCDSPGGVLYDLFLAPATGSVSGGYRVSTTAYGDVIYQYDAGIIACFAAGDLALSSQAYTKPVALAITSQPKAVKGEIGSTVQFKVTATGTGLSYQWQYKTASGTSWNNVSSMTGNKTATLSVPVTAARNGYSYRCKVTDADGNTVTSDAAKLTVTSGTALSITSQPASASGAVGSTVKFKVTATGTGLSYQWQYKTASGASWANVKSMAGYNTATLSVPVTAARNGYSYRCKVTDANGNTITSNAAKLTVTNSTSVSVTSQPAAAGGVVGSTVQFKVTATGTGLSYQWQYKTASGTSWTNVKSMAGYNTATLNVPVTAARNGYSYRCKVTDSAGKTAYSNGAKLTVKTKITSQPVSVEADVGTRVSFKVVATGAGLSYQWQFMRAEESSWNNCSGTGYNTEEYSFTAAERLNGHSYRCRITDANGASTYTNTVTFTAKGVVALAITGQPTNINAGIGSTAYLKVTAEGTSLSYQWQFMRAGESAWNNCSSTGNKTAQMSFKVSEKLNGHSYRCQITDGAGKTVYSNTVKLTVKTVITGQPENANAAVGEAVSFAVTATGAGLNYQWQFMRAGESAWYNSTCTGNKTAQISFTAAERLNGHSYRCVITDANGGQTYSNTATLTVE